MELLRKVGPLNLLLVSALAAVVLRFTGASATWLFLASAVGIIPLAGLMGKSTEIIAHRLGPGIGGLMNASFGNAAELIIAIFLLRAGHVATVKASITGSILGNILLVLGASFLAGGLKHRRQVFNATAAGMAATLLALAAVGLLVPALFHAHLSLHGQIDPAVERDVSLEIALVLAVVYGLLLVFSLRTHKHLYSPAESETAAEDSPVAAAHDLHGGEVPEWSQSVAIGVLLAATVGVAVMSEFLVHAIDEARAAFGWTELFVGVVVVAIVGNAAEHSTAIIVARKNQMDLSFQIAVGSGLQIALFVAPLLLFISYLPGFPQMDLVFSMLEVVAVTISVLIVGLVAYDGQSNWLEGLLLLAVYVILGIAFFHLPEDAAETSLHACEHLRALV
ncbi:MAG: calcium/proton exchanger [Planctomycetes bacterium]|nr:calcium/proton exchanger [Planctomycetota bacterium]